MANGFVTSRPAPYGDTWGALTTAYPWAGRWQAPGSGTLTLSELGGYFKVSSGTTTVKMKICEDDAANGCPGADVANSEVTFTVSSTTGETAYATYGTQPTIVGGNWYWICMITSNSNLSAYYLLGGTRSGVYTNGPTYPSWPTETEWHTHTDYNYDFGLYAVYSEAGGGLDIKTRKVILCG